ncbi:xenotropic and polytropic retrovirus receptor 1 homolog isoform X2 [Pollicipes pollicipes]|uniref:xenotropic and polytropic retrovirus receptor 1 homolog isoform X2 n=1 Tax=Pollicipes pollicipes TaxID=41117 RepID=UPI0018851E93|nr:xenotropic and polytropic retrovirus receptor 1 homolog isoform X2 [Pollicipes pollicipes]XP_037083472.1 xenotropic and polytropic retrovirus receptor 1 homolog isoform X2 [Pollicipes pollicipes]XP_037083473.1 xenotropic and polytropic retrovirus receptor 1 homolog isoform X2 [Pollicipes pollicipes]
MKFAEHLSAHITPEWRTQYIQYEEMKSKLYAALEKAPSAEVVDQEDVQRYFAGFDEHFLHFCDKELEKINTFFSEKLAEAQRKYASLQSELAARQDAEALPGSSKARGFGLRRRTSVRKAQNMKLAFSEFYLSLILLQNYQSLNFMGFKKILKKHDKILSLETGAKWRLDNVEPAVFYTNKDIDKLIRATENQVTADLEGGDRQKAMKRLRVPPLGEQQSPWTTFKVGLFLGAFVVLVTAVILTAVFHAEGHDWYTVLRLFRGPFHVTLFIFLIGINVHGWRSAGVNHVLIFELNPRSHLSAQALMEIAAIFGVIWAVMVLCFLYSESLGIPPYINPLILTTFMLVFLLNPTKSLRHEARFWLIKIVCRVLCAPFCHVGFADFWLADQINSLATVLQDFDFIVCFYVTQAGEWSEVKDPEDYSCFAPSFASHIVVACLPAWFRFAQCLRRYRDTREAFPHLVNAGKYSTSFFKVAFGTLYRTRMGDYDSHFENPYFYLFICSLLFNSIYTYTWDIKMDWGLFDSNAGDNRFLREELVYSTPVYYFAIVEDFVLRFLWSVGLVISVVQPGFPPVLAVISPPLEIFRRFVWNFFRLENEHLNNCGKFRAVRDISVAPIDASDQAEIIRMMDEESGVVNRRNRRKPGAGKRKDDRRLLLDGDEPDEQTYLSVTSADIRNWFRHLSGGPRGSRSRAPPGHYHHTDTFS